MARFDLKPDSVSLRTLLEFTAAAHRIGADIDPGHWLTRPYVNGVEVTQGIQYFGAERHLTNANDRGPDNSVRLVARKPAWARVYVRSGLLGADQVLTGDLIVEHRTGPFLGEWTQVATLAPLPPGAVTSQRDPAYATERGTLAIVHQLRRRRRAHGRHGALHRPHLARRRCDANAVDTWQETVDATLLQTLSLRGVFVHYNGPDPTINATNPPTSTCPAPGLANLQATAAWTLKTIPVEATAVFSSAGPMNWFSPLTDPAYRLGRLLGQLDGIQLRVVAHQEARRQPQRRHLLRPLAGEHAGRARLRLRDVRRQRRPGHGPAGHGPRDWARGQAPARAVRLAALPAGDEGRSPSRSWPTRPSTPAIPPMSRTIRRTARRPRSANTGSTSRTTQSIRRPIRTTCPTAGRRGSPSTITRSSSTTTPSIRGASVCSTGSRRTSSIRTCGRGNTSPIRHAGMAARET